jgi:hypothetical protein
MLPTPLSAAAVSRVSVLGDLLIDIPDVLEPGPSSRRGQLLLSATVGLIGVFLAAILLIVSDDAANQPAWAFGALVWMILIGTTGMASSLIHLAGYDGDAPAAYFCLFTNACGVGLSGYVLGA